MKNIQKQLIEKREQAYSVIMMKKFFTFTAHEYHMCERFEEEKIEYWFALKDGKEIEIKLTFDPNSSFQVNYLVEYKRLDSEDWIYLGHHEIWFSSECPLSRIS